MSEFKSFPSIENISKLKMCITFKVNGSNAQINIFEKDGVLDLTVGSRNRIITPEDDNFGFARFVYDNKEEFIQKLGKGLHFGEWAGPGINSGEGLSEKTFVLFNHWKFPKDRPLPPRTKVVPVLYKGKVDTSKIDEVMEKLKTEGSPLVPGFMRPEGIVIEIGNQRFKKVFDAEETGWKKGGKTKVKKEIPQEVLDLLHPIRMEKLLSREEKYNNPENINDLVKAYIEDLTKEVEGVVLSKELTSGVYMLARSFLKEWV